MSENNIPNEQDLWAVLNEPVTTEPKAKPERKPRSEGRFAKAAPVKEAPSESTSAGRFSKPEPAAEAAPAPASIPEAAREQVGSRLDGFFFTCMAGVAAVAVAATLLISSMLGGGSPAPSAKDPGEQPGETGSYSEADTEYLSQLEQENAQLRSQLELQREQIKNLQSDLITLMGADQYLSTAPTHSEDPDNPGDPDADSSNPLDEQLRAMELLAQIQDAYADFDRERLEQLIPKMDELLSYLPYESLNNYYLILEYMEQPSNG